jgi:uncharacterized protein YjiS (DUF1127 family)
MSAIANSRALGVAALADPIVALARGVFEAARKRAAFRRTVTQLSSLSDRELDDLGVSRWEIDQIAHRSVYGA